MKINGGKSENSARSCSHCGWTQVTSSVIIPSRPVPSTSYLSTTNPPSCLFLRPPDITNPPTPSPFTRIQVIQLTLPPRGLSSTISFSFNSVILFLRICIHRLCILCNLLPGHLRPCAVDRHFETDRHVWRFEEAPAGQSGRSSYCGLMLPANSLSGAVASAFFATKSLVDMHCSRSRGFIRC